MCPQKSGSESAHPALYRKYRLCFDLCALKAALALRLQLLFFPLWKWRIFPTRGPLSSEVSLWFIHY